MQAMKSNARAMWICGALALLVVAFVVAGVLGAWFLLAAISCALMMGAMVWMMLGMGRGGHGKAG